MNEEQIAVFKTRHESHLPRVAASLEAMIRDYLQGISHIDRVSARAKDPERFAVKARKQKDDGAPKYTSPLQEIQDQIGARVIVFYQDDVDKVSKQLERYFTHIEKKTMIPESEWEFGYFGHHWIFALPDDVVPATISKEDVPRYFELQVKTLFQHAWSEANHDLGYKAPVPLSTSQRRYLAFTAAQAWGADDAFERLRSELATSAQPRALSGGTPN